MSATRKGTHLARFLSKQLYRDPTDYEMEQFENVLHALMGRESNWFPEYICIKAFDRLIELGVFHPLYTRYIPPSRYAYMLDSE